MSIFYPNMLKNRITDVTEDDLRTLGVKGVLLDVDNTLTKFHSMDVADEVMAWIERMKAAGFALTIVSNGFAFRVQPFADKVGLRAISLACKPSPLGYWRAAHRLGLPRRACVAIGDQVFTDVLAARLAGVRIIQVMPIELEVRRPTIQLKRYFERGIVRRYRRKQGETE